MKAEISGGEVSDYKGFELLRGGPLPAPKVFIADKGYDSDHIRDAIAAEGGTPVIPARANRKEPEPIDRITYALRNHVERCFNKMKCSRRLATRYDKTAASYLGFVKSSLQGSGSGVCQHDLGHGLTTPCPNPVRRELY